MFGNIKPIKKYCGKDVCREYKKYYCGLCFAMDEQFGKLARVCINYDITNDFLLAASYCNEYEEHTARCPWSWRRKKVTYYTYPGLSEYFAKLNYLLVYYKMIDNVNDDNSTLAKKISNKMHDSVEKFRGELKVEEECLVRYLDSLHKIERENSFLPVFNVAQGFGVLLQGMVDPGIFEDVDRDIYARINYWVGIYIYTIDAVIDCISDHRKKRYNPITAGLELDPVSAMVYRRDELLDILKKCKKNTLDLLSMYPNVKNEEVLKALFDIKLPKTVCMYLEVKKDEIDS